MKTVWILTLLALAAISLSGCSSCGGGLFGNWFNRNDCCTTNTGGGMRYAAQVPVADGTHVADGKHVQPSAAPAR